MVLLHDRMSGTNTEISGSNDYTKAGMEGYVQTNNASNNVLVQMMEMEEITWILITGVKHSNNNHLEGNYVVVNFQLLMHSVY